MILLYHIFRVLSIYFCGVLWEVTQYDEAHRLHDQLWMHAHGIASMIATDFCDWNMKKAEDMLMEFQICLREKYNK